MKKTKILNYGIIIFSLLLYISLIFTDSIWSDEAFTMTAIRHDFIGITKTTAIDVHPPLYYYIVKIFTLLFGYSVPIAKFASIVPCILIMCIVTKKSEEIFKEKAGQIALIFNLLISFMPIAFIMNIEIRMYTWSMFFVTCSGIYAYEVYRKKNKRNIAIFLISSLCGAYTHYFAIVSIALIYLTLFILLIKKDKSNWKLCIFLAIITIIGYLPWLPTFLKQFRNVRTDYWIQDINVLADIKYLYQGKFTYAFLIVFVCIIIGFIRYLIKNKKDKEAILAVLAIINIFGTVLIGYILSMLIRPVFTSRYMYVAVGLFFLGVSMAISKIDYKNILKIVLTTLLIINLPFSYIAEFNKAYNNGTEEFKSFIYENIKESDKVSSDIIELSWEELEYYMPYKKVRYKIDESTRGYVITKKSLEKLQEIIPNTNIEQVFEGDIDNTYKFVIYYVE